MKTIKLLIVLSIFLVTLCFNSCTKEAGLKEVDKLSAADCPRRSSLTAEKKETLYTVKTYAGENYTSPDQPFSGDIIDGVLCKARFIRPYGIAINADGVIYIADQISNIRKINIKGEVSVFAGTTDGGGFDKGDQDGIGTQARFSNPDKLVLDKIGNQFLIDSEGSSIRKISSLAKVSTLISAFSREYGYKDGPLAQAKFNFYFICLAISSDGSIYLYEDSSLIRKISPEGIVSTYAGQIPINGQPQKGYQDGPKENALFGGLSDMTFAPDGSLYLCDVGNKKIRRITSAGIVETVTSLTEPLPQVVHYSIAISDKGIVFIANSTQVFRINSDGIALVIAGSQISAHKDAIGTEARFRDLKQMAIYKNYLYLTDDSTVRRMNIE